MYPQTSAEFMPSVIRTFALSLAIAFLGTMAGVFVPPSLFLPLAILEFVMLMIALFFRRKKQYLILSFIYLLLFQVLRYFQLFRITLLQLVQIS